MILKDPLLGVEPALRQELWLPAALPHPPTTVSSNPPAAAAAVQPLANAGTADTNTTPAAPEVSHHTAAAAAAATAPDLGLSANIADELIASDSNASAAQAGSALLPIKLEDSPPAEAGNASAHTGQADTAAAAADGDVDVKAVAPTQPHIVPPASAADNTADVDVKTEPEGSASMKEEPKPAAAVLPAATAAESVSTDAKPAGADRSGTVKQEATQAGTDSRDVPALDAGVTQPADVGAVGVKTEPEGSCSITEETKPAAALKPPASNIMPPPMAVVTSEKPLAAEDAYAVTDQLACSPAMRESQPVVPASDAAAPSTADEAQGPASVSAAAASANSGGTIAVPIEVAAVATAAIAVADKPPVVLGCAKCRWSPKGCATCRAKWQAAGHVLPSPPVGSSSNSLNAAEAQANAAAAAAAKVERAATTKLCNWLANRTALLASILKGTHKVSPAAAAQQQGQTRVTVSAPANRFHIKPTGGPVITTQQSRSPQSSVPAASGVAFQPPSAMGLPVSTGQQQQQNTVQMSQFRHQQRQQQLLAAQEQQRQKLLLQQQQKQHHTSLLRQQHQSAQLQQQQQQAARAQAVQAQALQQQQLRMRQQQQQQGLRQQQINQQLQFQQQMLQQQQHQRQMTAQQQVQRALVPSGSQAGFRMGPQTSAAYATAAQHAQYQQQAAASSKAQTSHPLSE